MAKCCGDAAVADGATGECRKATSKTITHSLREQRPSFTAIELVIQVDGMDCAGCATTVKNVVICMPGILSCNASYLTTILSIRFNDTLTSAAAIVESIEQAGHHCTVQTDAAREADEPEYLRDSHCRAARTRFLRSTPFSVAIIICTDIIPYFDRSTILSKFIVGEVSVGDCVVLILASVQLFCFNDATFKLVRDLQGGKTSVTTLSSLGILLAFTYSCIILFVKYITINSQQETFFSTFAELCSFVLLGRWLEVLATHYTTGKPNPFIKFLPCRVTVRGELGDRSVDSDDLEIDDVVVANPGICFAADGIVVSGESEVDESLFTGDFMPLLRRANDSVYAGTKNINGQVLYRVLKTGRHTQLSRLGETIEEAQQSKARIQLFADRLAFYFVPILLGIALATFVLWIRLDVSRTIWFLQYTAGPGGRWLMSIKMTIAVLVVSCPCALSVATPAAVVTGVRVGVENGLLIKGAAVLEDIQDITDVVFDKTGTLTQGKMAVDGIDLFETWSSEKDRQEFWLMVVAAESAVQDNHPIPNALVQYASLHISIPLPTDACSEHVTYPGQGVFCQVSGFSNGGAHRVLIGNEALLARFNIAAIPNSGPGRPDQNHKGKTVIYVSIDDYVAGRIFLCDSVKADGALTIKLLKDLKITPWMLTGDTLSSATPLARSLGIEDAHVYASCTIAQKATIISSMRSMGKHVVMVGDGVNDGPALLKANVGISMSGASHLAMESSDIILLRRDSLCDVVAVLHLAKAIYWRIKLNLFCAFAWTLIGIPFAMGLFLPLGWYLDPAIAGCGMAFSCACITGSSLLLRRWQRPESMLSEDERLERFAEKDRPQRTRGWFRRQKYSAIEVV